MANDAQASWKKALGVFEARLADLPLGSNTKLRYRKGIVSKVHLDFSTRLPDAEFPTLAAWTKFKAGRTEEIGRAHV